MSAGLECFLHTIQCHFTLLRADGKHPFKWGWWMKSRPLSLSVLFGERVPPLPSVHADAVVALQRAPALRKPFLLSFPSGGRYLRCAQIHFRSPTQQKQQQQQQQQLWLEEGKTGFTRKSVAVIAWLWKGCGSVVMEVVVASPRVVSLCLSVVV